MREPTGDDLVFLKPSAAMMLLTSTNSELPRIILERFLPLKLLLLTSTLLMCDGCSTISESQSYLLSQQVSHYGISADLWLLNTPISDGLLPLGYDPELGRFHYSSVGLDQFHAANRLNRLAEQRARFQGPAQRLVAAIAHNREELSLAGLLRKDESGALSRNDALWLQVLISQYRWAPSESLERNINRRASILRQDLREKLEASFSTAVTPLASSQTLEGTGLQDGPPLDRLTITQTALTLLEHGQTLKDLISLKAAGTALSKLSEFDRKRQETDAEPLSLAWQALAIAKHHAITSDAEQITRLFQITDQLMKLQSNSDFPGRFESRNRKLHGQPNAVRDALSTLALLQSLEIAAQQENSLKARKLRAAIWLALDNLRALQYDHGKIDAFKKPLEAVGAIRLTHNRARIRLLGVVLGAETFETAAALIGAGVL